jgi:PKD repeat protein
MYNRYNQLKPIYESVKHMNYKLLSLFLIAVMLQLPAIACENKNTPSVPNGNATTGNITIIDFWAENNNVNGTAPFNTNFQSNVTGKVSRWCWVFEPVDDDYYSQHALTAKHTFHEPGVYNITLECWDGTGKMASLTKPGYINVSSKSCQPGVGNANKSKYISDGGTHPREKITSQNASCSTKRWTQTNVSGIKSILWEFQQNYILVCTTTYNNGTVATSSIPMPQL